MKFTEVAICTNDPEVFFPVGHPELWFVVPWLRYTLEIDL